jgi:hypothetical protein
MNKILALLLLLVASPLFAANEIQLIAPEYTGQTIYMLVMDETGQVWNTTGTPAFSAISTSIGDFDISMTEPVASTGLFKGTLPGTSGQRTVVCYLQAGGSPASTDQQVQIDSGYFDSVAGTWKRPMLATGAVSQTSVADDSIDSGAIAASAIGTSELPRLPASGTLATAADVAAIDVGEPQSRDLLPVQFTWQIKPSGTGAYVSTNILDILPGTPSLRAGVNCKISAILPGGTVLNSMTEPTTSDSGNVTGTKTGNGDSIDQWNAKMNVACPADAEPASDVNDFDYLYTTLENSAGDEVNVALKVRVGTLPE